MVVFRCTRALLKLLPTPPSRAAARSSGRLGGWFVTVLFLKPKWWLLAVSEATRLPVIWQAQPLASLTSRFPTALYEVLRGLDISETAIAAELGALAEVVISTTNNPQCARDHE
jgi:hypothetical protein